MDINKVKMMITANLNCGVCLQTVANAYNKITRYNKYKFCGLVFHLNAPRSSVTLHKTGKIIICGVKSKKVVYRVIEKIDQMLKKIGYCPKATDIAIKTVTFSGKMSHQVNLIELKKLYPHSYYEPEIINGLRLTIPHTKGVLTIFHTGRFYSTGVDQKFILTRFIQALRIELEVFGKNGGKCAIEEDS